MSTMKDYGAARAARSDAGESLEGYGCHGKHATGTSKEMMRLRQRQDSQDSKAIVRLLQVKMMLRCLIQLREEEA
jgi:hypothetical protein